MLKDFITSQKAFNKNVEDKLEKLDNLVLKVDNIAHDVEMLKIRILPLEEEKDKPISTIQIKIDENIRMVAQLKARWAREEERNRAKPYPISTTLATINVVEDLKTFDTHHTPSPSRLTNGIVHTSTLEHISSPIQEATKVVVGETRDNDGIALPNKSTSLFDEDDLDFEDYNLTEVIKCLQRMARDPNTSKLNSTFTEHITNSLIKAREEKTRTLNFYS